MKVLKIVQLVWARWEMVTVKFFAMLKNKVGKETVELSVNEELSLEEFKESV